MNERQFELIKSLYEQTFRGYFPIKVGVYEYCSRPPGVDYGVYNLITYRELRQLERLEYIIRSQHAIELTRLGCKAFLEEL